MSLPSSVQTINIAKQGDYDVIRKSALPFPAPAPGDVVIKVEYSAVNFIDTYLRSGMYPIPAFPATLGMEPAGTVVRLPTDAKVLNDEEYRKRGFTLGGNVAAFTAGGAFAEYVSTPWSSVYPLPAGISTRTAAASLTGGITAVALMTESYTVKKGDTILIHTVAGGVGLVFAQVAKSLGATVIGTTSTREKAELARAYGADHVILYKAEDTVQRVLELTGGEGVDAIYDGVGKDTFEDNFKIIKRGGTIVSVGSASGPVAPFTPSKMTEKNIKLVIPAVVNYIVTPQEAYFYYTQVFERIAKGTLTVPVFKEYDFTAEDVVQAQKDLVGGRTTGKLLIRVAPGGATV